MGRWEVGWVDGWVNGWLERTKVASALTLDPSSVHWSLGFLILATVNEKYCLPYQ